MTTYNKVLDDKILKAGEADLRGIAITTGKKFETLKRRQRMLKQNKPTKEEARQEFGVFLSRGRTMRELVTEFALTEEEILSSLKRGKKDYNLFEQRNDFGEKVYIFLPKPETRWVPKKRRFTYAVAPSGRPWVTVQLPDSFPAKKNSDGTRRVDVVPISDVHYGATSYNHEKFLEYLEYIRVNDHVIGYLNGDLIDYSGKNSPGSAIFEQNVTPNQQVLDIIELLRPIAHKLVFSLPGNHEERSMRTDGLDVAQVIAMALDIPYFRGPTHMDISWKGYTWRFHCQHGVSNSMTEGGKLNAAKKPTYFHGDFHHFVVMGHVHDATIKEQRAICRNYETMDLEERKYYIVILPAFLDYWGSYGENKGWSPSAIGSISMHLYSNGKHHAGS